MRGPYVRFCERDEARRDHSRLTLLDAPPLRRGLPSKLRFTFLGKKLFC